MSALVRITTGIMPQHSRVGVSRAMSQFGEVVHCHKPPYSGIAGEDFVNVRFGNQSAADLAYEALKNCQVYIDGFLVGVGAAPKALGSDAQFAIANGQRAPPQGGRKARSPSPPRRYGRGIGRDSFGHQSQAIPNFPSRGDAKSPSPRRFAREMHMRPRDNRDRSRSRDRSPPRRSPVRYRRPDPPMPSFDQGGPTPRPPKNRERTPSPDPPGPVKNPNPVKNPFYRNRPAEDENDDDL